MSDGGPDARTLMIRSLNETRLLHPPTYVASRYLAESIASDPSSSWTPEVILRTFRLQTLPKLFEIVRLKRAIPDRPLEYRHYLIPSPTTSLAEAVVLSRLAGEQSFQKSPSVYSYRWPRLATHPYNFQYYINGYRQRNRAISAAFREHPGCVALVTDIERFYPTIRHDVLNERFANALDQTAVEPDVRETAFTLLRHITTHFNDVGIATGPEFSHVLGDLTLADVDREMDAKFPRKYFRYVDDFIIVLDAAQQDEVLQSLEESLHRLGLSLNVDKHDVVSSEEWLGHGPVHKAPARESFEALVFRLKLYLALRPRRFQELTEAFVSHGFNIPMERIRTASRLARFQKATQALHRKGWKVLIDALFDTPANILNFATKVRVNLKDRLKSLIDSGIPEGPTKRRWHMQRVRFLTNRILYLSPPEEWQFIEEALLGVPEFAETSALFKLLRHGDVSDLLHMPGPAVTAAASLLQQMGGTKAPIELPKAVSFPQIHSASVLLLYGVAKAPKEGFDTTEAGRDFLRFCEGEVSTERMRKDFTYLDELQSLQLQRSAEEKIYFLNNPLSGIEPSVFEALEIGGTYFS